MQSLIDKYKTSTPHQGVQRRKIMHRKTLAPRKGWNETMIFYWFSNKELTNSNIALAGVFIFNQNKLSSGGFTNYKEQEVSSFGN